MRVVVAPDAFKGTIDAAAAADALAAGWRSVRAADEVRCLPMADGGEGTLAAVVSASPGARLFDVPGVTGPDGRPVPGRFALLPDGTAVVELATASGLPLLEGELLPLTATTRGTGETVAAALDAGARRLLIGLGGSASTDGGHGLLSALGARLRDGAGEQLPPTPADFDLDRALAAARTVDLSALRPAPPGGVVLLTDVTNPLLGARGAAAVYGPQKGAGEREVALLERRLARWSELLGGDPAAPGAGAAGGTGYGLAAAWGALVEPGAAAVAGLLGLPAAVAAADLVVTGEGSFDATSLQGKAVGEVVRIADGAGVPSAVVAGVSEAPGVLTLSALAGSPGAARRDPARWLHRAGAALATCWDCPAAV